VSRPTLIARCVLRRSREEQWACPGDLNGYGFLVTEWAGPLPERLPPMAERDVEHERALIAFADRCLP
jgi:hypothetical protein